MNTDDVREFFQHFQDHLAPTLDTYEQAVYLYIFRHSRFLGLDEAVVALKSARAQIALGIGEAGKPMSEGTAYLKVASLQKKGCLTVIQTEHKGRRIRLLLPKEMKGVVPTKAEAAPEIAIEEMDFFNDEANRLAILRRENFRCFYTLRQIDESSFVIDHVISRPNGDNGYRNVVAASREANNRKGAMSAEDFCRSLFRSGYLTEAEFEGRLQALADLVAGSLKPVL